MKSYLEFTIFVASLTFAYSGLTRERLHGNFVFVAERGSRWEMKTHRLFFARNRP